MVSSSIAHSLWPLVEMMAALFLMAFGLRYLMTQYIHRRSSLTLSPLLVSVLDFFLYPKPENENPFSRPVRKGPTPTAWTVFVSFVGLQASYLVWGVMQERLMTSEYNGAKFPSSNMLVLSNRVFAIVFSAIAVWTLPQPRHRAPFVDYSFAAVANTISSYCQYEALRYMSFPMSTVSKACKIIPTMLMGKLVQGKTYPMSDYFYASIITLGVTIFALESVGGIEALAASWRTNVDPATFVPGFVLMITYLIVDAFTSNWQGRLYQEYQISPHQCMLGINVFSMGMGIFNLVQSASLMSSLEFLIHHPAAMVDIFIMSLSSAIGQLFIYYTIDINGPVIFSVITVTRQLFSIAISSLTFGHVITNLAWFGVLVTFSGILGNQLLGVPSKKR